VAGQFMHGPVEEIKTRKSARNRHNLPRFRRFTKSAYHLIREIAEPYVQRGFRTL
jgi:hypothetical protein